MRLSCIYPKEPHSDVIMIPNCLFITNPNWYAAFITKVHSGGTHKLLHKSSIPFSRRHIIAHNFHHHTLRSAQKRLVPLDATGGLETKKAPLSLRGAEKHIAHSVSQSVTYKQRCCSPSAGGAASFPPNWLLSNWRWWREKFGFTEQRRRRRLRIRYQNRESQKGHPPRACSPPKLLITPHASWH